MCRTTVLCQQKPLSIWILTKSWNCQIAPSSAVFWQTLMWSSRFWGLSLAYTLCLILCIYSGKAFSWLLMPAFWRGFLIWPTVVKEILCASKKFLCHSPQFFSVFSRSLVFFFSTNSWFCCTRYCCYLTDVFVLIFFPLPNNDLLH